MMKGSLKRKIAIRIAIFFSLLLAVVMFLVYMSFSDFRREEFENRFKQRLVFTIRFIEQSKDFDEEAPVFFSENSDNVLLNEQILIFNENKKLIYSTVKDENIQWDDHLLDELDKKNTIFNEKSVPEVYAALRTINHKKYYILTSAQDVSGETKLDYLRYLLLFSFCVTTIGGGFLVYYLLTLYLNPLEKLNQKLKGITAGHLNTPLQYVNTHDEIATLTQSFNTMLLRLNEVFDAQKSFTSSASHEIRTPLTRMAFQLENLIQSRGLKQDEKTKLESILADVYQLSDLTHSLLLLSNMEESSAQKVLDDFRIDEIIFDAYQKVENSFPGLKMDFTVSENISQDANFTVIGQKALLEIVFVNLFKNAALYSDNSKVEVTLHETDFSLYIHVDSFGETISEADQKMIFQAFSRGENAQQIQGFGLGLKIVKRILDYHHATIEYLVPCPKTNRFTISFTKKPIINL